MNSIASHCQVLSGSPLTLFSTLSLFPVTARGRALHRSQLDTPPDPTLWDLGGVQATAWSLPPLPAPHIPSRLFCSICPSGFLNTPHGFLPLFS